MTPGTLLIFAGRYSLHRVSPIEGVTERLVALMDHLGLGMAFLGTPIPRDISGLALQYPERLAGVVLCVPSRDPAQRGEGGVRILQSSARQLPEPPELRSRDHP